MIDALIGKSKAIKSIIKQIKKISARNDDVLIIGERGSGKSIIAKNIHDTRVNGKVQRPFIELKLVNIDEKELSAVLFGQPKRTSDVTDVSKKVHGALTDGGTILIDELENASFRNQTMVMQFLEMLHSLRSRINKHQDNLRVIITTSNDPLKLAEKNQLIKSLARHLSSFTRLFVPPLRERKEDIPHLVEHFVVEACRKIGVQEPVIDINAISILVDQPWKNNIAELKTVIERSVVFSTSGRFTLPQEMIDEQMTVTRMLESVLTGEGQEIDGSLDTIERGLIDSTLKRFQYNFSKAAMFLGMKKERLEHRAQQLGVVRTDK